MSEIKTKKPDWLRVKLPTGENYRKVREQVDTHKLHTICQSGNCPNMGECWGAGTATFMILGNVCTRSCGFCAVQTGKPSEVDYFEPAKVAESVHKIPEENKDKCSPGRLLEALQIFLQSLVPFED